MSEPIHDDEPDTSEATMRALLAAECPAWAALPADPLRTTGSDNALWRLRGEGADDLVVRLPRRPHAAERVEQEVRLLEDLRSTRIAAVVRTPVVRHLGGPHEAFPFRWSVLEWLDGVDAWSARDDLRHPEELAVDLAAAVVGIGQEAGLHAPSRLPGDRGGPIEALLQSLETWLGDPAWNAPALLDVPAVRRLAAEAVEVSAEPVVRGFTHGDLIPGNLLVAGGRLTGIIDWGSAGYGDVAQDLAPAWTVLEGRSRRIFREAVGADDAAWIRARTFELEHAVGAVLYYVPRGHPLGDVMARTLNRILTG